MIENQPFEPTCMDSVERRGPAGHDSPGVDGFLVSPADVDALTAALHRVMGDPALRGSVCHSIRRGTGKFSMERIAGMWEELFAELRQ